MTRIGIPARISNPRAGKRVAIANALTGLIVDRIASIGAVPVLLHEEDRTAPPLVDGLLLPGGGDLDPGMYGQEPDPHVYDVNPDQDNVDTAAVKFALQENLPILGICRGLQLINVLYSGTLIQHLAPSTVIHKYQLASRPKRLADTFSPHPVTTVPGTRLAGIVGETVVTASAHHQAIDRLG